ncbi:MAG: hypothetical protein E4H20_07950 [Spirochaetales bacterium]|nr:MAG: hypothetical protein E4H20_07950 [Spirochaetales bacterium]
MLHPKSIEWDESMKALFDRIDSILEDRYGGEWRLKRNRPARGATSNPEADGLFNVGSFFTPGYGSKFGRGYLVEIALATNEPVKSEVREEIELLVLDLVRRSLPEFFPGRELYVDRDGSMFKIYGDLSLDKPI